MKKSLLLTFILLGSLFVITGCGDNIENNEDDAKYSVYEMHLYDEDFKHTEELVAKYKEDGTIKYVETYVVWDDVRSCESSINSNSKSEDLKYPDVKYTCTNEDGKTIVKWSMTDKSLDNGYLKDKKDFKSDLKYIYEDIKEEASLKKILEQQAEGLRKENKFDERNYFVIDGKRIDS